MRPYENYRFVDGPDVGDIKAEGRASHVGRLPERCGVYKSYIRKATNRKAVRRYLKRSDKAQTTRRLAMEDDV
jgi:hypothetical protein